VSFLKEGRAKAVDGSLRQRFLSARSSASVSAAR
jgi:hypothetical protein